MTTSTGTDIFSLAGKNALVTGATGHLGTAMCQILAEAGAHVLVNSRTARKATELAKRIEEAGYKATPAVFDVTDSAAIERFFSEVFDKQALHIVINNAYSGGGGDSAHASSKDFLQSYDVGVVAAHRILTSTKANLLRAKEETGDSSIINVSSMYGLVSPERRNYGSAKSANPPFYGATKAALLQWTRYTACELAPAGIRVNAISPGAFPSPEAQRNDPEFIDRLSSRTPLGRVGEPQELNGATLFLASSASSYVTGTNIIVDGGWTAW